MTTRLRCLICNRPLRPFDPIHPNPEGHERSLLCENHLEKQLYEAGFKGLYGETDDHYLLRVREISTELCRQTVIQSWYTDGYFSLLFEFSKRGLLLIYPLAMAAMALYVPPERRAPESPVGLNVLTPSTLIGVKGPCDTKVNTKHGLEGITKAMEKALPLNGLESGQHHDGKQNPWKLLFCFEGSHHLEVTATCWSYDLGNDLDATDLNLEWRDGKGPTRLPSP